MEAEKPYGLLFANWKPRKAGGVSEDPRASLKARSAPSRRSKSQLTIRLTESESFLPPPFCSLQAFNRLDGDHPHWGR